MILAISGFEKSILISLYLGAFKLVLKVKSVPSFVMYWGEETQTICIRYSVLHLRIFNSGKTRQLQCKIEKLQVIERFSFECRKYFPFGLVLHHHRSKGLVKN